MPVDMHGQILTQLMHPGNMYSEETIQLTLLLVSGLRNDVWVNNTTIGWTPERGVRIHTNDRDIESPRGYYDVYVHDYYYEIYIRPARGGSVASSSVNMSSHRSLDTWDIDFQWQQMNLYLSMVDGQRS